MQKMIQTLKISIVAVALILSSSVANAAWTPAPASPPSGNIEAPINASSTAQTKTGSFITLTNLYSGMNALIGHLKSVSPLVLLSYLPAGTTGGVAADRFCLTPKNVNGDGCVTDWSSLGGGTGGTLPAGTLDQTLRHNGTTWVATDVLKTSVNAVTVNATGKDTLFLNSGFNPQNITAIINNKPNLQFWSSAGHNSDIIVRDIYATGLIPGNTGLDHVCADQSNGRLVLCAGTIPGTPGVNLTASTYTVSNTNSYTISAPVTLSWTTSNLANGQCTANGAWSGVKSYGGGTENITISHFGPTTFNISCTSDGGVVVTDTVTIIGSGYQTFYSTSTSGFRPDNYPAIGPYVTQFRMVAVGGGGAAAEEGCGTTNRCLHFPGQTDAGDTIVTSNLIGVNTTITAERGGKATNLINGDGAPGNGFASAGATVFNGFERAPGIVIISPTAPSGHGLGGFGIDDSPTVLPAIDDWAPDEIGQGGGGAGVEKTVPASPGNLMYFVWTIGGGGQGLCAGGPTNCGADGTPGVARIYWQ